MEIIYVLPSIALLAAKILIFWMGSYRTASVWLFLYFGSFFWMNIVEVSGFAYFNQNPEYALLPLCSYYIAIISAAFSLLMLSLEISGRLGNLLMKSLIVAWAFSCITMLVPGLVIADVKSIGYTLTRVPGPAYVIAPISVLITLAASLCVLFYSMKNNADEKVRRKSKILLISIAILFLTIGVVVALMYSGYQVNAAIVLSSAALISLTVLAFSERLFEFMVSGKERQKRDPIALMNKALLGEIKLDDSVKMFEFGIIMKTLDECGGSKTEAAKRLGTSASTIARRIRDHKAYQNKNNDNSKTSK